MLSPVGRLALFELPGRPPAAEDMEEPSNLKQRGIIILNVLSNFHEKIMTFVSVIIL